MIINGMRYSAGLFSDIAPVNSENPVPKTSLPAKKLVDKSYIAMHRNADTIQISSPHIKKDCESLQSVKSHIMNDINRDAAPEKLCELKSRIATGSYQIDTGELARILSE
ncbi:MAG TPA: hypothetical protein DG942_06945 [Ruminococcaceae bacterium]|jgi:anti-sigma28 factor (negative regulator of flagellin synthesis)|nr:hypothetical protein [Oscillospiraceae bacterium]